MFETLSWAYRFVFVFLLFSFILVSYFIKFKNNSKISFLLPIIVIIQTICSFALLTLYIEPYDIWAIYIGVSFILVYIFTRITFIKLYKFNDLLLLDTVYLMISIGLFILYRLSSDYCLRQLAFVIIGSVSFIILNAFNKKIPVTIRKQYYITGAIIVLSLAFTQLFGVQINGSKNWIKIFGQVFQPSEIIKILYVYYLACLLHENIDFIKYFKTTFSVLVIVAFFTLQKDLGSAFLFLAVYIVMLIIHDKKLIYTSITAIGSIGGAVASYFMFSHIQSRVLAWYQPWKYVSGKSYQITQSLFAVASGGLLGTGIFLGNPKYIPAIHTDFIFSAICEETGILSAIGILLLYCILTIWGLDLALRCRNKIYSLFALGLTSITAIQTLVIVCGVLNIIPVTGVTLPFISYGGSSLLSQFVNVAILYNIYRREAGEIIDIQK